MPSPTSNSAAFVILIDTREQTPLPMTTGSQPATLCTGDYSILGLEDRFAVERKSIGDLIGSLTTGRERFTRELQRLRAYDFRRLLVIGHEEEIKTGRYRSGASPTAMLHSLYSIEAKYCPVVFAPTPEAGAALIERWAFWYVRSALQCAKLSAPRSLI